MIKKSPLEQELEDKIMARQKEKQMHDMLFEQFPGAGVHVIIKMLEKLRKGMGKRTDIVCILEHINAVEEKFQNEIITLKGIILSLICNNVRRELKEKNGI